MSRHPELRKAVRSNGVSYACAFLRLDLGWDIERACSEPPRRRGRVKGSKNRERPIKLTPMQRKIIRDARPKKPRHRRGPSVPDTSPLYIRKLRAAYCDQFMKTGVMDRELGEQLRKYADECRAAKDASARVSAEEEAQHHRGRERTARDDGSGDARQIDRGAAERNHEYLRS